MKAVLLYVIFVQCIIESSFGRTSTVSQKERIKILRQKIHEEIWSKKGDSTGVLHPLNIEDSSAETLEYVMNEQLPITPISKKEDRKISHKLKLNTITTVKLDNKNGGIEFIDLTDGKGNASSSQLRSKKRRLKKKVPVKEPLDIFYRRNMYNVQMFNEKLHWVHCQDIITPFLTGAKKNFSLPKVLHAKDPTIIRLFSLLHVDTSSYSREDIYSVLYQISNLNLRFFRWDVGPIKMLFNIITKDKKHSFSSLKQGLRELFGRWRLDFTNSTALLRQTRIFRPPCVVINDDNKGSTKSRKVTIYPKKIEPTTPCPEYDEEDCKY